MPEDLTVDNLCAALRSFFQQIVEHPEQPVDQERGVVLYGDPGDATMKALMEMFNGTVKITIREMPIAMERTFSHEIAQGPGAILWEPSKEARQRGPVGPSIVVEARQE